MSESITKDGVVKGTLLQVPFPKVLNFINQAGKSGILALSQGKRKVHIHFDRGEIVYVTSSYFPDMGLGDFLMKEGKITLQVQEESVDKARASKMKQGAYLVEKGYLSPHDLFEALNKQVQEKLFSLFAWTEGEFFFKEGGIVDEEHRIVNISFPILLYRGVRSYLPMDRPPIEFRGRRESALVKRLTGRYKVEDLRLGPAETRVYHLVNGQHTMRQIISLSNTSKRAAYKVLYGLFLLELIGFPEAAKTDQLKLTTKKVKEEKSEKQKGYEISVAENVIRDAMASVDRIKKEVETEPEFPREPERAPRRPPPLHLAEEDEFAARVDETLAEGARPRASTRLESAPARPMPKPADDFDLDAFDSPSPAQKDEEPYALGKDQHAMAPQSGASAEADNEWAEENLAGEEEIGGETTAGDESLFMDLEEYSNPEDLLKQANILLDESRWSEARQFLDKALQLNDKNADAYALLGWAMFKEDPTGQGAKDAEQTIKQGIKLDPKRYLHYLYLGKIYAASNQRDFAELHFVKALELNVECSEAKEEIKRMYHR